MSDKKIIGLVTTWYPSKENPVRGSFFKEQAFATQEYFDYKVIHYKEQKNKLLVVYLFKKLFKKDYILEKINVEKNTVEYDLTVFYPICVGIINCLYDLYIKQIKKVFVSGIGAYYSNLYIKMKRKNVSKIFSKHFKNEIDILYGISAQTESSTLMFASETLGIPYVISEHAPFPWPGSAITNLEHKAIEHADLFMAISNDKIRQVLLQNIKLKKISYIGNLIDETQFSLKENKNAVKTFLIVAANSFYKNYDLFLQVMNRLDEIATVPYKVMIVGYGANKGYSQNVEDLENKIKTSRINNKVELIREIKHEDIQTVYHQADAFIMTSVQEGQPVSALEAACCGLPIFSTPCGGVEDYVDEQVGKIVPINDIEAFANVLNDFLLDKITFDSQIIRDKIVSCFGKKQFANNFKNIIYEVLTDKEYGK